MTDVTGLVWNHTCRVSVFHDALESLTETHQRHTLFQLLGLKLLPFFRGKITVLDAARGFNESPAPSCSPDSMA